MDIDKYAADLIRIKVRGLVATGKIPASEAEDLEQDLRVDFVERIGGYDPAIAKRTTFIRVIVDHRIADTLKRLKSPTKSPCSTIISLHTTFKYEDGEEVELVATVDGGRGERRDLRDLRLDTEQIVSSMAPEFQQVCEMLKLDMPIGEIARKMNVDRRTVTRWMGKILKRFEDAQMRGYLYDPGVPHRVELW